MECVTPEPNISMEMVVLAAGEQVGYDNLSYNFHMNKAVVVFLKEKNICESADRVRPSYEK